MSQFAPPPPPQYPSLPPSFKLSKALSVPERTNKKGVKKMSFIILFGIPGSGKSFFAGDLGRKLEKDGYKVEIMSRDDYRFHDGKYLYRKENEAGIHCAFLNNLYGVSTRRDRDIVILDDANLEFDYIVAALLAIDNTYNDVFLVDFEPMVFEESFNNFTKVAGPIGKQKFRFFYDMYKRTKERLKQLHLETITIEAPDKDLYEVDRQHYYEFRTGEEVEAFNKVNSFVHVYKKKFFSILNFSPCVSYGFKRTIFDAFKSYLINKLKFIPQPIQPIQIKSNEGEEKEKEEEEKPIDIVKRDDDDKEEEEVEDGEIVEPDEKKPKLTFVRNNPVKDKIVKAMKKTFSFKSEAEEDLLANLLTFMGVDESDLVANEDEEDKREDDNDDEDDDKDDDEDDDDLGDLDDIY